MNEVRLRLAVPSDVSALMAMEALFPSDQMQARNLRRLLHAPSARVWLADDARSGVSLGSLILLFRRGGRWARVYSLVVVPAARGRGIAQQLVACAEAAALAAGCFGLRLEVRVDNHAARALYARLGYLEVDMLPGYYDDGADGLRLARRFD